MRITRALPASALLALAVATGACYDDMCPAGSVAAPACTPPRPLPTPTPTPGLGLTLEDAPASSGLSFGPASRGEASVPR